MQTMNYYYSNNHRRNNKIRQKRRRKRYGRFIFILVVGVAAGSLLFASRILVGETKGEEPENPEHELIMTAIPEAEKASEKEPEAETNMKADTGTEAEESNTGQAVYNYAAPVPQSPAVDDRYFDDAVFIGDSRTEGLILNTGLSNATAYAHKGLMVDTVFTKAVINMDGDKISVMDALNRTDFKKVYIMLGVNETGWPYSDVFIEKYEKVIEEIQSINPEAIIYVQEIIPVTESVSSTHSYVKNEKIYEFNRLIREMSEEKQVYCIDTGNAVGADGKSLPEEAAVDGIHLNKAYCEKWLEYLKTHTVQP